MAQIHVIEPCYEELEKIKAQMIADNKTKDEPERISFSKVVCMLIREYYSSKRMGVSNNDLSENSDGGEEHVLSPDVVSPTPVSKLFFNVSEKNKDEFLDLNMKFYVLHQNEIDDVSIAVEDGKHVVFVETSVVEQYRKFLGDFGFKEA